MNSNSVFLVKVKSICQRFIPYRRKYKPNGYFFYNDLDINSKFTELIVFY